MFLIAGTAFDDSDGGSYAGITSTTALSFTTVNSVPTLTSSVPADDATDVERMQILFLILVKMLMLKVEI